MTSSTSKHLSDNLKHWFIFKHVIPTYCICCWKCRTCKTKQPADIHVYTKRRVYFSIFAAVFSYTQLGIIIHVGLRNRINLVSVTRLFILSTIFCNEIYFGDDVYRLGVYFCLMLAVFSLETANQSLSLTIFYGMFEITAKCLFVNKECGFISLSVLALLL